MHTGQLIDNTDPDGQSQAIRRASYAIDNDLKWRAFCVPECAAVTAFEIGNHPAIINGRQELITEGACRQIKLKSLQSRHPPQRGDTTAVPQWECAAFVEKDRQSGLFYVITQESGGIRFPSSPMFLGASYAKRTILGAALHFSSPFTFIRRTPYDDNELQYSPRAYDPEDWNIGARLPWVSVDQVMETMEEPKRKLAQGKLLYQYANVEPGLGVPGVARWSNIDDLMNFKRAFPRGLVRLAPPGVCADMPYHPFLYGE